jgi:hypothetical protein
MMPMHTLHIWFDDCLCKCARRSRFFVNAVGTQTGSSTAKPDEPAEQQVIVKLLHQLALGTDRVDRLQERGA